MSDTSSEKLLTVAGSSGDSVFSGFGSDLNTPVGSEIDDSTETTRSDEEEDDFIVELTRQMAENMLQEDEDDEEKSMTSESFDLSVEQSSSTIKYCHGQGLLSTPKSETPTSVLPNPTTQIYPNQSQQKHEYRQVQNREYGGHGSRRAGFLSALQAEPGMRVVFLGGVRSRSSGSSGTGVFLPYAPNSNAAAAAAGAADHQSRKKTGCSTVLVPERVLQTLKHHFEKRAAQLHSNGALHTQQNQRLQSDETPQTIMNTQELQLPQEWTY